MAGLQPLHISSDYRVNVISLIDLKWLLDLGSLASAQGRNEKSNSLLSSVDKLRRPECLGESLITAVGGFPE
jgi:hypothetical protein